MEKNYIHNNIDSYLISCSKMDNIQTVFRLRVIRHFHTILVLSGWFFESERVEEMDSALLLENFTFTLELIVRYSLPTLFHIDVIITAFVMNDGVLYSF